MDAPGILLAPLASLLLAASSDGAEAASGVPTGAWLDAIISVVGLGITLFAGICWVIYDRRDPLRLAPVRPNRLMPQSLLIASGVYLIALSSLMLFAKPQAAAPLEPKPTDPFLIIGDSVAKLVGIGACLALAAPAFAGGLRGFFLGYLPSRREGRISDGVAAEGAEADVPQAGTTSAGGALRAGLLGVVLGIVSLPLCYSLLWTTLKVLSVVLPGYHADEHSTMKLLHDPGRSPVVAFGLYVGAAAVAPLAEEVFFRGILQTVLVNLLRSRWRAILLTSVAFAAVHAQPQQLHVLPPLFLLAVILGFAYERTGGLIAPLIIHVVFNGKTLLWNLLWP